MRFVLIGTVGVEAAGARVPIDRPRRRAVLAYLALRANQTVGLGQLAEALWGGQPPGTARKQVQADVAAIRRALREAGLGVPIVTTWAGYRLSAGPGQVDLDGFVREVDQARRLAQLGDVTAAAGRLRPLLDRWHPEPLSDIDAWFAEAARHRIDEQRLDAVALLAELDIALGLGRAHVGRLRQLVDLHPLREDLWVLLMLALHRANRRGEALATARQLRRVLVEHGLDPARRTIALESMILRDDPALAGSAGGRAEAARMSAG